MWEGSRHKNRYTVFSLDLFVTGSTWFGWLFDFGFGVSQINLMSWHGGLSGDITQSCWFANNVSIFLNSVGFLDWQNLKPKVYFDLGTIEPSKESILMTQSELVWFRVFIFGENTQLLFIWVHIQNSSIRKMSVYEWSRTHRRALRIGFGHCAEIALKEITPFSPRHFTWNPKRYNI